MNESKLLLAIAAGFLGVIAVAVVVGGIILASADDTIPDALIAIGSAAAGALAALLPARSSS